MSPLLERPSSPTEGNITMADTPIPAPTQEIVASKLPADNGYGRNGYLGPSSDEPGKHTTSGFLPKVTVPSDPKQTRTVSADGYPAAHGMRDRSADTVTKIGDRPSRPKKYPLSSCGPAGQRTSGNPVRRMSMRHRA